ncbi:alpha-galactosidase [Steroidobacter agaridevorans]|uniref:Alpha-galactosidase n=1 Tax=Steroidobacter agaridevorans TaxID=2695856 RepID=A0A829Y6U5_9GAMM|nr:NPCBM/NEW2 domain-containing protein [Steroidobacter agaridevorans]GFE78773.1 alpha-galactosidase [Steroidobacter agaridevorans]
MRITAIASLAALLLSTDLSAASAAGETTFWLDQVDLKAIKQRRGVPLANLAVGGGKLIMDGKTYERGIGTRSISELVLDLHGEATRFSAVVGLDDSANDRKREGTVRFEVWVDDKQAADTGILKVGDAPKTFDVNLTGARTITLLLDDGGDTSNGDLANWANARIELASATSRRPTPYVARPAPMPKIASTTSSKPAIHGPLVYGATPGRPFLYRIPATGAGTLRFAADSLPAGLRLDPATGIITGQLAKEGTTDLQLKVTNAEGSATRPFRIVAGQHKLALTPPMGWNSWNVWGTAVDDAKVRAAADWLVRSGLASYGYNHIVIDDAWTSGRDDKGELKPNEKFPDMKALADYIHSKGLKFGIYSSPGPKTCGDFQGSYQHEAQDAATFARWGVDFLKYDWCSYDDVAQDRSLAELKKPYRIMGNALAAQNRDIVFNLCQYGYGDVWKWGGEVGGHMWRTTGDLLDMWANLDSVGFRQAGRERYVSPGRWNDTDMLVVGPVGWGPDLHPTRLTPDEQVLHITLWAMQAAPLFIGADLSKLDPFTIALLTNDEVLDVNLDVLAKAGGRVWSKDRTEIWSRPLADGTIAVALFNRGLDSHRIEARWSDLGLKGTQPVRNLWERRDLGNFDGGYAIEVPSHGAVMLKIGQAK